MAEMKARNIVITLAILMFVQAHPVLAQKIILDVGTLAPEGSPWHEILLEMRQEWRRHFWWPRSASHLSERRPG